MAEPSFTPKKHSLSYRFLSKPWINLWDSLLLTEPEKKQVVRWPCVEEYPGPEQEMYSEESYGNFISSVVRREVFFCARETSITFTKCSQTS